jgi:hypothetical protein
MAAPSVLNGKMINFSLLFFFFFFLEKEPPHNRAELKWMKSGRKANSPILLFFRNERLRSGCSPTNNERAGEWGGERRTDVGGSHPGSPAAHGTHTLRLKENPTQRHTHKDDDCPVKYPVAGGLSVLNELKIELSLPNPFHRSSNPIRKSN